MNTFAVYEVFEDKKVLLGVIQGPDSETKANERAEQFRKDGRNVEVLPYESEGRYHC